MVGGMITNDEVRSIIEACKEAGFEGIRLRDVTYAWLSVFAFADATLAYKAVFGGDDDFDVENGKRYGSTPQIKYLQTMIRESFGKKNLMASKQDSEEVTFEMNKQGIIQLIKDTEFAMAQNQIEKKDGLKILTDLRVKLNDKFNVQEQVVDQVVIVEKKYNHICKYGYECYLPTKEELMEMYDLVPRNSNDNN